MVDMSGKQELILRELVHLLVLGDDCTYREKHYRRKGAKIMYDYTKNMNKNMESYRGSKFVSRLETIKRKRRKSKRSKMIGRV